VAGTQRTEGLLTDQEKEEKKEDGLEAYRREATLRNGTKISYGHALHAWKSLLELYDDHPELFQALVAMVKHKVTPPKKVLNRLWEAGRLRSDRTVLPDIAAVLEAAYEVPPSPDKTPLVYPILHIDPAQRAALQQLENDAPLRGLRAVFKPEEGRSP
jgi:hypothetical protein